jgi:hypothetical protein
MRKDDVDASAKESAHQVEITVKVQRFCALKT